MKLNIWNIVDWLDRKKYKASFQIDDVDAYAYSARWFNGAIENRELLYVSDEGTDHAVILHSKNLIFVENCKPEDLLNEVCSIFDYYNTWEAGINACIFQPDGLQQMVDQTFEVLHNPIFVYNITGRILAMSKQLGPETSEHWADLLHFGYIPDDFMQMMKKEMNLSKVFLDREPTFHRENLPDGSGGFLHCGLFMENTRVAQFVVTERFGLLSMGAKHLVRVLIDVMNLHFAINAERYRPTRNMDILLADLLEEKPESAEQLELLLLNSGWHLDDPMVMLAIAEDAVAEPVFLSRVKNAVSQALPYSIAIIRRRKILVLMNCRFHGGQEAVLQELRAFKNDFYSGTSRIFQGYENIYAHYMQAITALRYGTMEGIRTVNIDECAVWAIYQILTRTAWVSSLVHPAVLTLARYDNENDTQLLKSLYIYLRTGGNTAAAAQELFVHRNSMRYRIDRIIELTGLDLTDSRTCEHLVLSYQIWNNTGPRRDLPGHKFVL